MPNVWSTRRWQQRRGCRGSYSRMDGLSASSTFDRPLLRDRSNGSVSTAAAPHMWLALRMAGTVKYRQWQRSSSRRNMTQSSANCRTRRRRAASQDTSAPMVCERQPAVKRRHTGAVRYGRPLGRCGSSDTHTAKLCPCGLQLLDQHRWNAAGELVGGHRGVIGDNRPDVGPDNPREQAVWV